MIVKDSSSSTFHTNPNSTVMNLKKQLRFYLERNDMTAAQLARKAQVPKQSLSGWLSGNNPRDIRQIKRVADTLSTTLDNLLFGEGSDQTPKNSSDLGALIGDEWFSGVFEMKIRRVKK